MSSKKLDSILGSAPAATVYGETKAISTSVKIKNIPSEENARIVASIPQQLKNEIRDYIKQNKGETERTVLLKSLKKMGFTVDASWIIDKRSLR